MTQRDERVEAFHRLHASGCFVLPNPWDAGSAVALEGMGFKALATTSAGHAWTLARSDSGSTAAFAQTGSKAAATTSAGHAWTLARPDNGVRRDEALEHLRLVAGAVDVPVNADFENCFADDPHGVGVNVQLAAATGVAGLSIEDSTGDAGEPLYPFDLAVERVRAARQAIDDSGTGVLLTGRSEGFVVGRPDLERDDTQAAGVRRRGRGLPLRAEDRNDRSRSLPSSPRSRPGRSICSPTLPSSPWRRPPASASAGVSVGGTLARTAWAGFLAAAEEIATEGTFTRFVDLPNVDAVFGS